MKNDELLHKWINGKLTDAELAKFQQRPEYQSLADLYKNTEGLAAPAFDKEAMLTGILGSAKVVPISPKTGRRVFLYRWAAYAAAASLLLLAGWFLFLNNPATVYQMAKGETLEGELPDQSTFHLNAESTLSFSKKTWRQNRELELQGEAFFSVQTGSKFTVKTANGNVQVLGTKFNVRSRGDVLDVQCTHGKVAVLTTGGQLVAELSPFDAVTFEKGKTPDRYRIDGVEDVSWTRGITKLRKVSIGQVIEELERQFAIEIKTEGVDLSEVINSNFPNNDLEAAFKTALPADLELEKRSDRVFVLKNK